MGLLKGLLFNVIYWIKLLFVLVVLIVGWDLAALETVRNSFFINLLIFGRLFQPGRQSSYANDFMRILLLYIIWISTGVYLTNGEI